MSFFYKIVISFIVVKFFYKIVSLSFLIFAFGIEGSAQNNPFEVEYRKKNIIYKTDNEVVQKIDSTKSVDIERISQEYANPFDVSHVPLQKKIVTKAVQKKNNRSNKGSLQAADNFIVWPYILLILLFTASIFGLSKNRILSLYAGLLNKNVVNGQIYAENNGLSFLSLLAHLVIWFCFGLWLLKIINYFSMPIAITHHYLFFLGLGSLMTWMLLRYLAFWIISKLYPFKKNIISYRNQYLHANLCSAVVLVPFILFIYYGPQSIMPISLAIFGSILLVFHFWSLVRGFLINQKLIFDYKFHFFLYLCGIEILPIVLIYCQFRIS